MSKPVLAIRLVQNSDKGLVFNGNKQILLAKMTFSLRTSDLMVIEHTEVSGWLRGPRAGRLMFQKLVEVAQYQGMKVLPLCPYAESSLKKSQACSNLLHT